MRAIGYVCAARNEAPDIPGALMRKLGPLVPGAGSEWQSRAIADACRHRGWELIGVHVDGAVGETAWDAALQALGGAARVLVVAKLAALGPWEQLDRLLARSREEEWSILALDCRIDSSTAHGTLALQTFASHARRLGPPALPLPPADLMFRVIGSDNAERFHVGGSLALAELDAMLARHGSGLAAADAILDFGCGPGRLLRPLTEVVPGARLWGVDQDAQAIAWVRDHLPSVRTEVSGPQPPLSLADGSFDAIVAFSVFTHLDEAYQDAWLAELRRLARSGGHVLCTVHGPRKWEELRRGPLAPDPMIDDVAARFADRGFVHWTGDDWAAFFPDYYHTSFHAPAYIESHWTRWFDVLEIVPAPDRWPGDDLLYSGHDIVVLRSPV